MSTAEQLVFSIQLECRGIHLLIWDDQHDLVRTLLIMQGAVCNLVLKPLLVPTTDSELAALCGKLYEQPRDSDSLRVLFVPQAANAIVGPWLNGARIPLSEPPGTLLIVRSPDLSSFQAFAPDLASFIGPRIFDCASMLSMVSSDTHDRMSPTLSAEFMDILRNLPGTRPTQEEIDSWYAGMGERASRASDQ